MKKKLVCILGHQGGIGQAVKQAFLLQGMLVIPVHRGVLDLHSSDADQQLTSILTNGQPDVIVNAAGVFVNGYDQSHHETMDVNFGTNWNLVKHYAKEKNQNKPIRIIMIGSSSYTGGRKLYPLYSASKAALYNLWQSASEQFETTDIKIDLVNPVRTLTKMASAGKAIDSNLPYLKPEQVAEKIIMLVKENLNSRCVDMTFEDNK